MDGFLSFQKELEKKVRKKVKLRINDNRTTMLSVRWAPDAMRVSLHRMFLQAPNNVMDALACYLRGKDKVLSPEVNAFIENCLKHVNYSHKLNVDKLVVQGNYYNLQDIYDEVNEEYFKKELNLYITWFGKPFRKKRNSITFGLYDRTQHLVKIHRLLDSPCVPRYVVSYVVYHEMLHHVCPSEVNEQGKNCIHTKEFKKREKGFRYFGIAQEWIKNNEQQIFRGL